MSFSITWWQCCIFLIIKCHHEQWFQTLVLRTPCPACFRCFPAPTHLIQMNGSLSSSAEACLWPFIWITCGSYSPHYHTWTFLLNIPHRGALRTRVENHWSRELNLVVIWRSQTLSTLVCVCVWVGGCAKSVGCVWWERGKGRETDKDGCLPLSMVCWCLAVHISLLIPSITWLLESTSFSLGFLIKKITVFSPNSRRERDKCIITYINWTTQDRKSVV